jgi:aldehyde:ferredoxin oxidoreductase
MLTVGERVRNIERAIMVRQGRRRADDTLAAHCFTEPPVKDSSASKNAGCVPGPDGHWIKVNRSLDRRKWERLKDFYYTERGWDLTTGIPTRSRLEALDLKDIADDLEDQGISLTQENPPKAI